MKYDIVITGATGFVGSSYVKYFHGKGKKVLALTRDWESHELIKRFSDCKAADITKEVPRLQAKICIHCAGLANESSSEELLNKVNLEGTKNVFNNMDCDHFVFISSASVYPPSSEVHYEVENIDLSKLSRYGRSKRKAELWLLEQNFSNKKITIIRPRAIYGIGDRVLLPRILGLKRGPFVIVPANLNYNVSITCIDNLLLATQYIINQQTNLNHEIFNVADDKTYNLGQVIKSIIDASYPKSIELKIPNNLVVYLSKFVKSTSVSEETVKFFLNSHLVSNTKIKEQLGAELKQNLENYLPKLKDWINLVGPKNILEDKLLPWKY